jgi:hypothetical protein
LRDSTANDDRSNNELGSLPTAHDVCKNRNKTPRLKWHLSVKNTLEPVLLERL